ncbi:hypothetical protein Angca_001147, partial [Angiostrongylus cantonensis]
MRPSGDILDEFYALADLDSKKRTDAVSRLLMKVRLNSSAQDYCVERLVTGLSSPRGAARLGYSSALCILLMEAHELWTTNRLFALADKKLDLHDKENGRANAIGRHLLVSAICRSKMYSEANVVLLEHELEIYRACPSLGMSVAQQMAELISEIDKKTFKSVFLVLFVQKDGSCRFSESDLTFLLLTVKKCDTSALEPFLKLILASSRQSGQFSDVYRDVIEKWCTSGDESKVLERIFDTAKLTLSNSSEAHKEVLKYFIRIIRPPHTVSLVSITCRILDFSCFRYWWCFHPFYLRGLCSVLQIADFCKFVEDFLSLTEDSDLLEVIETLDTTENFDSLTGSNLIGHLIGRLSREGVAKWIQTAGKPWSFGHICTAFPHWSNDAKVEALSALLHRAKSEQLQYAVGNCISCLFKMKVRAGAFVSASLVEGGEDVLRQVVTTAFGKHVVKSAMKKLDGSVCYKGTLMVFWMCLNLWSKVASSNQMSRGYYNNAEELLMVVEGGEESLTVLLDQLMALLSQPLKYHRTVVYYVFVHLLEYIKDEHIAHIIQTLMMNDDELVEEQESDANSSSNGDNGKFIHIQNLSISNNFCDFKAMDCETIDRLETSLGSAAVKRKGGTVDEEETDVSDVGDAEMFEMDDRLAAAFKSIASKKENKMTAHLTSVFRLKLADLLLFALSSLSTPASVKVHMIIPLLKLAKLQLKQSSECDNYRKTMSLLKIISHLKKIHLADEEVVSLLDQLVQECIETVLSAFIGLFERFMTQEDGLIGSDLAVAAVVKHPEAFVSKSKVFLKAAFNENYRIFRRVGASVLTSALMCLSTIMSRKVLQKVPVEKSVVKGIAKLSSQYFVASLAQPETIKPRFFASVLKLLVSVASGVPGEYKYTLQKHLTLECLTEDEEKWNEVSKKINSASQQV